MYEGKMSVARTRQYFEELVEIKETVEMSHKQNKKEYDKERQTYQEDNDNQSKLEMLPQE